MAGDLEYPQDHECALKADYTNLSSVVHDLAGDLRILGPTLREQGKRIEALAAEVREVREMIRRLDQLGTSRT